MVFIVSIAMRMRAWLRVTRFYPQKKRTRGKEEHTTAREKNDASALEQNRKNASRCTIFKKNEYFSKCAMRTFEFK
jgi:hypothetical protein